VARSGSHQFSTAEVSSKTQEWVVTALQYMDAICFPDDSRIKLNTGDGTRWWITMTKRGRYLAGYAAITPSSQWGDACYLSRAGVLPDFRGYRLQRRLIRIRCAAARRAGYAWAVTDTSDTNVVSSNNLIREGFELFTPSRPWGLRKGLYWKKEL